MIIFLSCTKKKRAYPCEAKEMYKESQWFKGGWNYAQSLNPDAIYILSAKYGLIEPHEKIAPYEKTLSSARLDEVKNWSIKVARQIQTKGINTEQKAIFLCGKNYRRYVQNLFPVHIAPLAHLGIGEQMKYFKTHTKRGHLK